MSRKGNPNPRTDHLTPFNKIPKEEMQKIASSGGKASVESKRKAKTFNAMLNLLLDEVDPETGKTKRELLSDAMLGKAQEGNVEAFKAVRDSAGEKPADSLNVQGNINNPLEGLTTEELRALAYQDGPKPKRKRGRPKKVQTDD